MCQKYQVTMKHKSISNLDNHVEVTGSGAEVIPHADHQDHAAIQSLAHRLHSSHLREAVAILERRLLGLAALVSLKVLVSEGTIVGMVNLLAVLDIELLNANQFTMWSVEPGHNLEWP